MTTFSCAPQMRQGIQDSSQHVISENGTPLFYVYGRGDALYLTNLLNLTTEEQRDQARAMLYQAAAE